MSNILKNITMLYVEEDKRLRKKLISILESVLKKVYVSTDGLEALKIYKENDDTIDIVLTNVVLPGINGIELLKEVRKIHTKIPFMINTECNDSDLLNLIKPGLRKEPQ